MVGDSQAQVSILLDHVNAQLSKPDPMLLDFVTAWWSRTPEEDLQPRDADNDAAASIDTWRMFRTRQPDATEIHISNPDHARDGWESPHTVVRVLTPDRSFVTDSVLMALSHDGLVTHHFANLVFGTRRAPDGCIEAFSSARDWPQREVFIYAEIDRIAPERIAELEQRLTEALADVRAAVDDFALMRARLHELAETLRQNPPPVPADELEESLALLEWLGQNNFTMLGYRRFDYRDGTIRQDVGATLGMLRNRRIATPRPLAEQRAQVRDFLMKPVLVVFSQSGTRTRVHRPAYPDYIGIREIDAAGNVVGEHGFLGLYTARVYLERPERIPLVRSKVARVLERSGLAPTGFDGKVLNQLLTTYPKSDLFQTDEDDLLAKALRITYIHERKRTRLFVRHDPYGLFVHCLVYLPRELYNTQVRLRIIEILSDAYGAFDAQFEPYFSESVLVRLQVTLRKRPEQDCEVDEHALGLRLLDATRDWNADFQIELIQQFGESESRRLGQDYALAFPAAYRERFSVRIAVYDLSHIEALTPAVPLKTYFYRRPEEDSERLHLKIFHLGTPLLLSDVVATLENFGLRIRAEHPYHIQRAHAADAAMLDFDLEYPQPLDLEGIGDRFSEAFEQIWTHAIDDDAYNRLLLAADLNWRQINVLRSYARYLKQIRLGFGQTFISDTLGRYPAIAAGLVRYFERRFDPACTDLVAADGQRDALLGMFDQVVLLNEDRMLRRILELISATVRTNYFRLADHDAKGTADHPALALKLTPTVIAGMPKPVPAFEIFISSATLEGVHLRGGPIARGGLRWSDRSEDYRTEILGLVKAQTVKNALIVPTGAKGGFIVRHPSSDPDLLREQGRTCYQAFVSGLLDVTDNVIEGQLTHPANVRCLDGDDPYLVVAADKGTASFSDLANEIAVRHGFWLGDAFASGGSNGYDHKAMGITARGAWISVARHFAERGVDVQHDRISVIGIGDMSGDVFGNGMLRSRAIALVAAFNHQHIFIDPMPDPDRSFEERARLAALSRSAWSDYDRTLVSPGGGIFDRSAKIIAITPEMRTTFEIEENFLTPDELISRLLRAHVDLIWNGGIGTYVKAAAESHEAVGDRANDSLRINAEALRCRVFGEGGNLGMTQPARVVFALAGGGINTDFIDNSAGVDCSDHEVNIKIVLDRLVNDGELTLKHRNRLLKDMTDEVADLVLINSFRQAQLLSHAERQVRDHRTEFQRFLALMESSEQLDRNLEALPSDEQLAERASRHEALTRPELAVLLAFAKMHIKRALGRSTIIADPLIRREMFQAFPATLVERFPSAILEHRLAGEIVATALANDLVDHMGITFVTHLVEFIGATVEDVVRAWLAVARIFSIRERYRAIESSIRVPEPRRLAAICELVRLGRRATRWALRHERGPLDVARLVERYADTTHAVDAEIATLLGDAAWNARCADIELLIEQDIEPSTAEVLVVSADRALALTIAAAAEQCGAAPAALVPIFAALGRELDLSWLIERLRELPYVSHWQAMERDALIDGMIEQQGRLAGHVWASAGGDLETWLAARTDFLSAWRRVLGEAHQVSQPEFSLYSVTCRKLIELGRIT